MDFKIILIIILLIVVIGFGVISFVPFGGKKLLCPASTSSCPSGYIAQSSCPASTSSCPSGYIDQSSCPASTSTTTPATAASCQTFVAAETAKYTGAAGVSWCKSTFSAADLQTISSGCKAQQDRLNAIATSIINVLGDDTYIKKVISTTSGSTVTYKKYYGKGAITTTSSFTLADTVFTSATAYNITTLAATSMTGHTTNLNDIDSVVSNVNQTATTLFPTTAPMTSTDTMLAGSFADAMALSTSWSAGPISDDKTTQYFILNLTSLIASFKKDIMTNNTTYKNFCA